MTQTHTQWETEIEIERNPNITLIIVIKSQGKRAKGGERNEKELWKTEELNNE